MLFSLDYFHFCFIFVSRNDDVTYESNDAPKSIPKKKTVQINSVNGNNNFTNNNNNNSNNFNQSSSQHSSPRTQKSGISTVQGPSKRGNPLPEWNDNSDFSSLSDLPLNVMRKLSPRNDSMAGWTDRQID